jgi:predicted component of type VI protein secretion system
MKQRCLRGLKGSCRGQVFPVRGRITIGRDADNDIQVVDDEAISRHHACVYETDDGKVMIQDLGSRNGTFVGAGDERVTSAVLQPGGAFRTGVARFVFEEVHEAQFAGHMDANAVKVLSGPAVGLTASPLAKGATSCTDPAHAGVNTRYRFCPTCGERLR